MVPDTGPEGETDLAQWAGPDWLPYRQTWRGDTCHGGAPPRDEGREADIFVQRRGFLGSLVCYMVSPGRKKGTGPPEIPGGA